MGAYWVSDGGWLAIAIAGAHFHHAGAPPTPNTPGAERAAQAAYRAAELVKEIEHEKKFYAEQEKDVKVGIVSPTLIQVETPNGENVTGKWLFITQCPKGFYCAQPDGRLTDEIGMDVNQQDTVDDAAPSDMP